MAVRLSFLTTSSTKHLFRHVVIALWRRNANLWLHHQPTLPSKLNLTVFCSQSFFAAVEFFVVTCCFFLSLICFSYGFIF